MAKITKDAGNQASAMQTWAEYRQLMTNEGDALAQKYVRATYKKASQRKTVRTMYLPVWGYVVDVASPAMDLPFKLIGSDAFKALMRKWRPTLSRCWKVRRATGSIYPHVARRRGRLIMEMLWGDSLRIEPDPECPSEWDFLHSITLATADSRRLVYARDPKTDAVSARIVHADGSYVDTNLLDDWNLIPVFPMYRDGTGVLQPKPDRTLLDIHLSVVLMLTDTDFRRKYRTAILYRKSQMVEENKSSGGADIEASPDAVAELGDQDTLGIVESGIKSREDLEYIENYLRLSAKLLKLPPELFITDTRAETGAAKGWDYRPLMELQQRDRQEADEWLSSFLTEVRPVLEAEGIVKLGEQVSAETVPSKLPMPADPLQYALGIEKLMELGMTSAVREMSMREGVGFAQAKKLIRYNQEQNALLGRPAKGVEPAPPDEEPPVEDGTPAAPISFPAPAARPSAPVAGVGEAPAEVAENLSVNPAGALNGAQIQAALSVIEQIVTKQMPEEAGAELLTAMGIDGDSVQKMIKAMKKFTPKPPPAAPE